MNHRERFKAITHFESVDYVPIFGFPGAAGVSRSYWTQIRYRLAETGMPAGVGSEIRAGKNYEDIEGWRKYWGTTGPMDCGITLARGIRGLAEKRRTEGGFEIIESESGALTRQVVDNDNTYGMPEFIRYDVRDRASWEFYRERMTPAGQMNREEFEAACRQFEPRDLPLLVKVTGAYYFLRELMGTEQLSLALYDDPELIQEMTHWHLEQCRRHVFPVVERLRPEIVNMNEDVCFKNGMLLAPAHFKKIAGPQYGEVSELVRACGVDVLSVDSDGYVMDFVPLAAAYGVNGFYPFEVKPGNDLFALRRQHPRLIFGGWLEKEVMNEGNERMIEAQIASKVPQLLKEGGYFPNADHSLQPPVTFPNLCKFMTCLHEVCGNPEGEFPRR